MADGTAFGCLGRDKKGIINSIFHWGIPGKMLFFLKFPDGEAGEDGESNLSIGKNSFIISCTAGWLCGILRPIGAKQRSVYLRNVICGKNINVF